MGMSSEGPVGRIGQTIENPLTGEGVTFIQTTESTNGALLQIECAIPRPGFGPPLHIHLKQQETFRVVSGSLGVAAGRERHILGPGQGAVAPPGVPHRFWNAGQDEVRFIAEIAPPGQFEAHFETMFGLAREGKGSRRGVPTNLWQFGVSFEVADTYLYGIPVIAQRIVLGILARIGRRLGYRARYARYSDPDFAG